MVLDNADDKDLLLGQNSNKLKENTKFHQSLGALAKYLPDNPLGKILITTRDRRIGDALVNKAAHSVITVTPLGPLDAKQLFRNKFPDSDSWDETQTLELLETLNFLPLAISQAAAYIGEQDIKLTYYLELLCAGDADTKDLLEEQYYDPGRDQELQNSILRTWSLSFEQIKGQKRRAADILSLMAVLDRQAVPATLLRDPDEGKVHFDTAIGTLRAFSLIAPTEEKELTFQMHRLVQIPTQRWLENEGVLRTWEEKA